jgi:hypothetical protein
MSISKTDLRPAASSRYHRVRGYVAHGVRPEGVPLSETGESLYADFTWQLLAVVIAHLEGRDFEVDAVLRDTDTAAIVPTLRRYGLYKLTEMSVEEIGLPLAEAWVYASHLLDKPPKRPPHDYSSWRHMLVMQRNEDLQHAVYRQFGGYRFPRQTALAWEKSRNYYNADDIEAAERWLCIAERRLIKEARASKAKQKADPL